MLFGSTSIVFWIPAAMMLLLVTTLTGRIRCTAFAAFSPKPYCSQLPLSAHHYRYYTQRTLVPLPRTTIFRNPPPLWESSIPRMKPRSARSQSSTSSFATTLLLYNSRAALDDDYTDDDDEEEENDDEEDSLEMKDRLYVAPSFRSSQFFADDTTAAVTTPTTVVDKSAIQTRRLRLGYDFTLSQYLGNMGFEEVTDWEYYYYDDDMDNTYNFDRSQQNSIPLSSNRRRKVVQPNPFDASKPKRTRTASGSVVRLFRGEWIGSIGGRIASLGLDRRVLIKEFSGPVARQLAVRELKTVSRLQANLLHRQQKKEDVGNDWAALAASRGDSPKAERLDNTHIISLIQWLQTEPFVGIIGQVNLDDEQNENDGNWDANAFYRKLGVAPPKIFNQSERGERDRREGLGAVWIVYEYAGLSSLQSYAAKPPEARLNIEAARPSPPRGFWEAWIRPSPPSLPSFEQRAHYIVQGIMKQAIQAVAFVHENGLVHRSIGRSSFILSAKTMDKRVASTPFAISTTQLVVKLADYGFAGLHSEATTQDPEFCTRARTFGLSIRLGDKPTISSTNFAMAEDMHALGFVFLGLLLTALAELPATTTASSTADTTISTILPATDEDSLQRLLGDIFDKDFEQFREYVQEEDVWSSLVELLDRRNGAGWTVLKTLMLAREKATSVAAASGNNRQLFSIRGLLANPFFSNG